ncbi:MAG TPA: peptide ABC transporter substrate-binding protein [Candidatus Limnocylindria bacterium]|nr:peptide ABC transporter substrate-binding protein [Candidatus Limnocylindria bacterium]
MIDRTTKLRWRRRFKKRRQQVEDISVNAEQGLERHFFKRLGRLMSVWRFAASWLVLLVLVAVGTILQTRALGQHYQILQPAPGGTYTEGIIGTFTSANPLYATSAADSSVSRLVFSGLMRYNQENKLVPDLAESISVDPTGKVYTVTLRNNLKWHDGKPLTARDVAFTYEVIKNPDARSPLFNTWKEIQVTEKNAQTLVFELPNVLSTFPEGLTNGIVPRHVLEAVEPAQLRSARFNTVAPIGSGPFMWDRLEVTGTTQETRQEVIGLSPSQVFYRSPPKLGQFIIRTFRDEQQMASAYQAGELTSMVGLASISDDIREVPDFVEYSVPLTGIVLVFFKTTEPPLDDVKVRRALVQSVDTSAAINTLGYPVQLAKGPLLDLHIGFDPKLTQLPFRTARAAASLDAAGWKMSNNGIRRKAGQELTFTLYAQNTSDYSAVSGFVQKAWRDLGVKTEVLLQNDADMQGVVSRHDYAALLYGISIGTDPDVFAYWHSTQASPNSPARLNLSEYKSKVADLSLEAGRTRLDPAVRAAKYAPFLKAWRDDAPALALYQPTFLYVTRGKVFNFEPESLNGITNRYVNVENWMIRQERVTK